MVKFSVLISNHNYGIYLRECIDSVLNQSRQADEIIVVDDGSTDESAQILNQYYTGNPKIKVILQGSDGQTAALATGVENATGTIICLLDSDDRYKPNYLAELEAHYQAHPYVDMTFCRFEPFGLPPYRSNEASIWLSPARDYDYGYTARLTYFGNIDWIGNYTSMVSLRAHLARRLDLRQVAQTFANRAQGEYPFVVGASLLGGRKYYLHKALIEYRHHQKNLSWSAHESSQGRYVRRYYDEARVNFYRRRSGIDEKMKWQLGEEAATAPDPLPEHLRQYRKTFLLSLMPPFLLGMFKWLKKKGRPVAKNPDIPL